MKKRIFYIVVLLLCMVAPSHAVLKEDSLSSTLRILRAELYTYHKEYAQKQALLRMAGKQARTTLIETMQSSNQNALMLYSQKDGYVFDLAYACHAAIEQYKDFGRNLIPFKSYVEKSNGEVARIDSLIKCLRSMPVMMLSPQAKTDRNVCMALAINIQNRVKEDRDLLNEYIFFYDFTEKRLKSLNDYANQRYSDIQHSIFKNGGDNYLTILTRFRYYLSQSTESFNEKYVSNIGIRSQWDSKWIVGLFVVILFYGVIAILLNQLVVRFLVTRLIKKGMKSGYIRSGRNNSEGADGQPVEGTADNTKSLADFFLEKRTMIILATTAVTFAIILGIVGALSKQHFVMMASSLLVQYAWLLSVVIISILVRVKSELAMKTLFVYMPLLVNGFLVISFRVVLIPNALVNVIFPPLLLICCLWQWRMLNKHKEIERSDRFYAYISQFVFITSLVSSMVGYTLMSVQILIWWIMQLTCILTITCLRDWYKGYAARKHLKEKPITQVWFHSIIYWVVLPSAAVFSVVLSLYWAADVFNLSDLTWSLFNKDFVDTPNFRASIFGIAQVLVMWFIFNYISHTAKAFVKMYFEEQDPSNAAQRFMMVKNVLQILIWGIWFMASLAVFNVSNQWLVILSAGFSTGIGFASKDILENIYYGISLMAGRIKIGDLIVCDGVRGTVSSISYTSTMIDTTDGSVIAFQNSQLFTKNYKNLTRNHGFECHILDVGVAYGTKVADAKKVIVDAVSRLKCINKKKGVSVVLKELGDSALVLKVIVWVNVFTQYGDDGIILEAIYNALNEHDIEIPFPQTDVHIKEMPFKGNSVNAEA